MTYLGFGSIYVYETSTYDEGFLVYTKRDKDVIKGGNVFLCNNNKVISVELLCDNKNDCNGTEQSDEKYCECKTTDTYTSLCKYLFGTHEEIICSDLYMTTFNGQCMTYRSSLNLINFNLHKKHMAIPVKMNIICLMPLYRAA